MGALGLRHVEDTLEESPMRKASPKKKRRTWRDDDDDDDDEDDEGEKGGQDDAQDTGWISDVAEGDGVSDNSEDDDDEPKEHHRAARRPIFTLAALAILVLGPPRCSRILDFATPPRAIGREDHAFCARRAFLSDPLSTFMAVAGTAHHEYVKKSRY